MKSVERIKDVSASERLWQPLIREHLREVTQEGQ
jgi:hypothetical protein